MNVTMSFYLKPPRGEVNLHTLLECVQQRILCYDNLDDVTGLKNIDKFEYLIEDSVLDRTSHFIFRMGVLIGYLPMKVFLDNELELLKIRLNAYEIDDMTRFLKNIIRQLKDCIRLNIEKNLSDFYWSLYNVTTKFVGKEYLSHIFEGHIKDDSHSECSKDLWMAIPFWYCNDYVTKRSVNLKNGNAFFHCSQWRHVITTLFKSYLKIALIEMKYSRNVSASLADDRISSCLQLLKNQYCKQKFQSVGSIALRNIEEESIYFPLCMKSLFDSLRKNHRLAHNERFNLSLFLKGVGLSLDDSLKFWQGEYSQENSACSKCSHTWQKNEKKYVYSIRHLYGLEGSRKNYSMKSCNHLQSSELGINSEGGCPFVHHDDDHLRSLLKTNLPGMEDDVEVIIFERKENPKVACKLYGECISKQLKENSFLEENNFDNPLEFTYLVKGRKQNLT
ncbi:probable DNA primase large subunit [Harmonia axyridis]|uniref:probable DNA primase large subunit n=1 Tax=Harmonia axyridis TaxID=115357 RepID=UPI001E2763A3|nr:probable DNA primase large subunit [Harmonia axyridis]